MRYEEGEDEIIDTSYNTSTMNSDQFSNQTALQIRLDTRTLIEDFELFLRGSKVVLLQKEDGSIVTRKVDSAELQRANEKGIQTLLSYLSNIINSQTVQGNLDENQYESYIRDKHLELLNMLIDNCENWAIDEDDIQPIIDTAMSIIIPFMSRPLKNKERESYGTTIRTYESNNTQPQKQSGAFNF